MNSFEDEAWLYSSSCDKTIVTTAAFCNVIQVQTNEYQHRDEAANFHIHIPDKTVLTLKEEKGPNVSGPSPRSTQICDSELSFIATV